jgi:hypothetical protein
MKTLTGCVEPKRCTPVWNILVKDGVSKSTEAIAKFFTNRRQPNPRYEIFRRAAKDVVALRTRKPAFRLKDEDYESSFGRRSTHMC